MRAAAHQERLLSLYPTDHPGREPEGRRQPGGRTRQAENLVRRYPRRRNRGRGDVGGHDVDHPARGHGGERPLVARAKAAGLRLAVHATGGARPRTAGPGHDGGSALDRPEQPGRAGPDDPPHRQAANPDAADPQTRLRTALGRRSGRGGGHLEPLGRPSGGGAGRRRRRHASRPGAIGPDCRPLRRRATFRGGADQEPDRGAARGRAAGRDDDPGDAARHFDRTA